MASLFFFGPLAGHRILKILQPLLCPRAAAAQPIDGQPGHGDDQSEHRELHDPGIIDQQLCKQDGHGVSHETSFKFPVPSFTFRCSINPQHETWNLKPLTL
jgi:hypothetical protein